MTKFISLPPKTFLFLLPLFASCLYALGGLDTGSRLVSENDVTWTTLGENENDSMPIGNGDIAANVWTEQNGDLVLLVAKSDAWTETGKIVKLGRLRIKLSPNPFVGASNFSQTLKLEDGAIEIQSGENVLRVWIDANHPAMHVEGHLAVPATLQANLELWRTNVDSSSSPSPQRGGLFEFGGHPLPIDFEPDTVLPAGADSLTWCHYNIVSIYPTVFQQEHLESLLSKYPDPYLHRCFGATITGPGLVASDDHTLKSSSPEKYIRLDLYALTEENTSPQTWENDLKTLAGKIHRVSVQKAWTGHQQWWDAFWNRSWIHVGGSPDATKVSQGYVMQRYMMACSSRGPQPAKFNGGLFTVGHDMPENKDSSNENHNPDFRAWGSSYWNQNNRLLYWPLIATGDEDLLQPWYQMYLDALPLAEDRTRLYYHHGGAAYVETMYYWGLPNLNDFGWDNPTNVLVSEWMRYHIQGTLEVIAQMLDTYDYTQDADFAQHKLVPFATAIVDYYDQHWPRDADGKIRMSPSQSLETYQRDAVNPTPDIAGLESVLPRLLALPYKLTSQEQRDTWSNVLRDLPPIAMGKTSHGKLPRTGTGDADGTTIIMPAEKYGHTRNAENPQLYVAFPYRLYGVGKPGLDLARDTYAARLFPFVTCWGQDGTQAAVLGLTARAQSVAISEFTDYGDERFRWFWKAGGDWIPDLDDGGSGMITLQLMLMQCDGKRIMLLPAWPFDWTADFKLNAPYQTTVEGHVENGHVSKLKVTPSSRTKDVVIQPVQ
jgi:alpha-L-fucosidase 2